MARTSSWNDVGLLALRLGVGGALVAETMTVAGSTHTANGFFNTAGGYELPATFGLVGTALALGGPGKFSLDHALGHTVNRRGMAVVGLAATIGSAAYLIATRTVPGPASEEAGATESSAANEDAPAMPEESGS